MLRTVRSILLAVVLSVSWAPLASAQQPVTIAGGLDDTNTSLGLIVASLNAISDAVGTTGSTLPASAVNVGGKEGVNIVGQTCSTEGSYVACHRLLIDPDTNQPVSYAGCTPMGFISAASVNETAIKGSAGRLYWVDITSLDATPVYAKFYDDTTANTDETDTPKLRIGVPANATASLMAGHTLSFPNGAAFANAITVRLTTGIADNDTGAVSANEVLLNACYL